MPNGILDKNEECNQIVKGKGITCSTSGRARLPSGVTLGIGFSYSWGLDVTG